MKLFKFRFKFIPDHIIASEPLQTVRVVYDLSLEDIYSILRTALKIFLSLPVTNLLIVNTETYECRMHVPPRGQ